MGQSRLVRTVLVLVGLSAAVFLIKEFGGFFMYFSDIVLILFLGWILATFLRRPADFLEDRLHWNRVLSRLAAFMVLLVPFIVVLAFLVPVTISQVTQLAQTAPTLIADVPILARKFQEALAGIGIHVELETFVAQFSLEDMARDVFGTIGQNTLAIATQVGDLIFKFLLTLVIAFYILVTGEHISDSIFRLIPEPYSPLIRRVFRQMDVTFTQYMRGMFVIGSIYALGTFIVMVALGLPFALPISILAGFLVVLPFVGDIIAISIPVVVALLTATPGVTLLALIVLVILQQTMNNVVSPRVVGRAVNLPAMLVLLTVVIGAKVAGFWGTLLGVPLIAASYYLALAWVEQHNTHRNAEPEIVRVQD